MHRGILVEKFEGKKPPRTPGLGWEDIFKTGLMQFATVFARSAHKRDVKGKLQLKRKEWSEAGYLASVSAVWSCFTKQLVT